jgi:predicted neutral ceramidase superfamily lipid hydrolase
LEVSFETLSGGRSGASKRFWRDRRAEVVERDRRVRVGCDWRIAKARTREELKELMIKVILELSWC